MKADGQGRRGSSGRGALRGPWPGLLRDAGLTAALVSCGVGAAATTGATGPVSVFLPLLALAALATGRASAEYRLAPLWLGGTVVWFLARAALEAEPWSGMADAIVTVMFGVLPWLIGRHLRQRSALLRAGWQRAASLERELAAVSEQERLRERAHIAEEMHDSLGHELSLMAVRAGALEVAPGLAEEEFRRAAGDLREGANSAIEGLQEIIGVLDATDGGSADMPGAGAQGSAAAPDGGRVRGAAGEGGTGPAGDAVAGAGADAGVGSRENTGEVQGNGAQRSGAEAPAVPAESADRCPRGGVAALVRRAADAGMEIEWDGREPGGPESVARLAETVVREGLTNAAKHAPGARVAITVEAGPRRGRAVLRGAATTVAVANEAPGGAAAPPAAGGGRGLARLGDRVRDAGGSLDAGPRDDGGFGVAARLPHRSAGVYPARRRPREPVSVLVVCVGLLLPLIVAWYAYAAYLDRNAALGARTYARMTVGQQESEVRPLLPESSLPGTALIPGALRGAVGGDPTPACTYYRSRVGPPWSPAFYYRVCFQDGRLVAKCSYNRARLTESSALSCTGSAASRATSTGGADTGDGTGADAGKGNP
ncbi:sensor histidine kinase [Streptomonospora litoralis]|uniref:histidine kinase n=1 Tax=Streptomonospora litoralis TaxID=2498135 RepID=A0A4P6Q2Q3_9ACTN|nr:histidine kinase [Streptomonospora litoralis]QBI53064.1 Histidine kinase [Streptomonospora litoralis]